MTGDTGAQAFAAFRETVFDDFSLRTWLHVPLERDAFIARVVASGAERGFVFEAADLRAAVREGEQAWLMQGVEVVA